MRRPSKTLAICLLFVLGGVSAPVAAEIPSAAERSRALLEVLRAEWEAPAVSGAVAVDGEVVFAAATGRHPFLPFLSPFLSAPLSLALQATGIQSLGCDFCHEAL
jgi:hypothetical protein